MCFQIRSCPTELDERIVDDAVNLARSYRDEPDMLDKMVDEIDGFINRRVVRALTIYFLHKLQNLKS